MMPMYVYGCNKDKTHQRVETAHGVNEIVEMWCPDCGAQMHRIPQAFSYYLNPAMVLYDKLDDQYRQWRAKRKGV